MVCRHDAVEAERRPVARFRPAPAGRFRPAPRGGSPAIPQLPGAVGMGQRRWRGVLPVPRSRAERYSPTILRCRRTLEQLEGDSVRVQEVEAVSPGVLPGRDQDGFRADPYAVGSEVLVGGPDVVGQEAQVRAPGIARPCLDRSANWFTVLHELQDVFGAAGEPQMDNPEPRPGKAGDAREVLGAPLLVPNDL